MSEDRSLSDFLDAGDDAGTDGASETADEGVADAVGDDGTEVESAADDAGEEAAVGETDDETAVAGVEEAESTVSPTTITAEWTPGGAECAACGETVQRRWRDGENAEAPDRLVCADCKTW